MGPVPICFMTRVEFGGLSGRKKDLAFNPKPESFVHLQLLAA